MAQVGGASDHRLKLDRARQHIRELEQILERHAEMNPYRLACEYKQAEAVVSDYVKLPPPPMAYHYRIETVCPLPHSVSLAFGDAIHNLRAALDAWAHGVIVGNAGDPNFTGFPFHEERQNFETALGNSKNPSSRIPDAAKTALLDQVQPYRQGSGSELWHMNRLDVIDKHRRLLTTFEITGMKNFAMPGLLKGLMGHVSNSNPDGHLAVSTSPIVPTDQTAFTFRVVIDEVDHFTGEDLIGTLCRLVKETEKALDILEHA